MSLRRFLVGTRPNPPPPPEAPVWRVSRQDPEAPSGAPWEFVAEYAAPLAEVWRDLRPCPDTGLREGDLVRAEGEGPTAHALVLDEGAEELPRLSSLPGVWPRVVTWHIRRGSDWRGFWHECANPQEFLHIVARLGADPRRMARALVHLTEHWPQGAPPEDTLGVHGVLAQALGLLDRRWPPGPSQRRVVEEAASALLGRAQAQSNEALNLWGRAAATATFAAARAASGEALPEGDHWIADVGADLGEAMIASGAVAYRYKGAVPELVAALRRDWFPLSQVLRAYLGAL